VVSLREWHLQARLGVSRRASRLLHRTFVGLRRALPTVGGRLNFGVSGRCSIAMVRTPRRPTYSSEKVTAKAYGKSFKRLASFWCDIEACFLKEFNGYSNVQWLEGSSLPQCTKSSNHGDDASVRFSSPSTTGEYNSFTLQPSSAATCSRALSSASLAGLPAQWPLEGLPYGSSTTILIESTTSGAIGVLALNPGKFVETFQAYERHLACTYRQIRAARSMEG
jgi:hypothetical protein